MYRTGVYYCVVDFSKLSQESNSIDVINVKLLFA